ncbi:MAG: hypothetical protein WAP35_04880 [Solirubrobacterales bacterium]
MGLFGRRRPQRTSKIKLHVADAAFDEWPIVADYEQLTTAMAFCQVLRDAGIAAELTSDWELDNFGAGDIALRVHPDEDQFAARDLIDIAPETEIDEDEEFDDWLAT